MLILETVAAFLGGLLFRMRGGFGAPAIRRFWPGYGSQAARIGFAVLTAAMAAAVAQDWRLLALVPAIWGGIVFGWFRAADIGRDGDRERLNEFFIMTLRGLWLTSAPALVFYILDYGGAFRLALSGLVLGGIYELGHRTPTLAFQFRRGMEIAEVYTGGWLWGWVFWAAS